MQATGSTKSDWLGDDLTDGELAAQAAEGSSRAFEVIMRRHNQLLFRLARSILGADPEAEDVVQEAYLSAYRALSSFRGDARLSTWLGRIVTNEALRRVGRRSPTISLDDLGPDRAEAAESAVVQFRPVAAEAPDRAAARAEIRRLVEQAIDALSTDLRTVFVLSAIEQRSVREIAETLDIPEPTVKTRAFRARRRLRAALSHELNTVLTDSFPFLGARCDRIVARVRERLGFSETHSKA